MNACFGVPVRELIGRVDVAGISYPVIPEPVPTPNDDARAMLGISMEEQLLVVNNLRAKNEHFQSKKTFSKRREWISELDTCIVSKNLINFIENFNVIRDNYLTSDHPPIIITLQSPSLCLQTLTIRPSELSKHDAELITTGFRNSRPPSSRPPVLYQNVDLD